MATTDWLGALLQAVGQGGSTYYNVKQQEKDRAIEAEQRAQAKAERDRQFAAQDRAFKQSQDQFDYGRAKDIYESSTPDQNFADSPDTMALLTKAGLPLNKRLEHTPGTETGPMALPTGQSVGLSAPPPPIGKQNDEFAPAPGPTPPAPGPMLSPVGGMTLGSVKDTATRPKTVQELAMEELQKAFGGGTDASPNRMLTALTAKRAGVTLPSDRVPQWHPGVIADSDSPTGYVRLGTDPDTGENLRAPAPPPSAASKPTYRSMAGPNGSPAVFALYADGRPPQMVGYQADKDQSVVFVDADGNQRQVYVPSRYSQVGPRDVEEDVAPHGVTPSGTPPPAKGGGVPFTPPQSAGVGGRNLGPVRNPVAVDNAENLRKALRAEPAYTKMSDMAQGWDAVQAGLSVGNGMGDIAAINAYQRLVDPGVSVREGDVQLLRSASAFLDRWLSEYPIERLEKGAVLPAATRKQMREMAEKLFKARAARFEETTGSVYRKLASQQGVNYDDIAGMSSTPGPRKGETRVINGKPHTWDGQGWIEGGQ